MPPQLLDSFLKAKGKLDSSPDSSMNDVVDALHSLTSVRHRPSEHLPRTEPSDALLIICRFGGRATRTIAFSHILRTPVNVQTSTP